MRRLKVIGIGAGNPDHVTIEAVKALNALDIVFLPDKGSEKEELRRLRQTICQRFIERPGTRFVDVPIPVRSAEPSYHEGVEAWHAAIAGTYRRLFEEHLADGACGGLLVWGDPSLYDSTLRMLARIEAAGLTLAIEVVPGISSVQVLAARHQLALNRIGGSVAIMPGRRLAAGIPETIDDVVVVLDGDRAYRKLADTDLDIFWGACLGTEDECLVAGPLGEVMDEIERLRGELRAAKGWVMDTYLLRRRGPAGDDG